MMTNNNKANDCFVFNERHAIAFQLQLFYKEKDERRSITFDAVIRLENNTPLLYLDLDSQTDIPQRDVHYILSTVIKKNDYKIINPKVNGLPIKLKIGKELFFTHYFTKQGKESMIKKNLCTMQLQHLSYKYDVQNNDYEKTYRLSSISSSLLIPYLTEFVEDNGVCVGAQAVKGSFRCFNKQISFSRDDKYAYIQTEENISDILLVLSLFFCNHIEYDMAFTPQKDGHCNVEVREPEYKALGTKDNDILQYLFCEKVCFTYFRDFLYILNTHASFPKDTTTIKKYIDNYVRAEYLDEITKLLLYNTIIEKLAGVKNGDNTYDAISKYLENNHIDVNKLNDGIETRNIKDNYDKTIGNFVQLRNFYVHHLGSEEATQFLKDSDILFYLKQAITILLLKQLGFTDLEFDKGFHNISVFDSTVKEFDYRNYALEKCKDIF